MRACQPKRSPLRGRSKLEPRGSRARNAPASRPLSLRGRWRALSALRSVSSGAPGSSRSSSDGGADADNHTTTTTQQQPPTPLPPIELAYARSCLSALLLTSRARERGAPVRAKAKPTRAAPTCAARLARCSHNESHASEGGAQQTAGPNCCCCCRGRHRGSRCFSCRV